MNPKRAYGSCTLIGIIAVQGIDPNFKVHLDPKATSPPSPRAPLRTPFGGSMERLGASGKKPRTERKAPNSSNSKA